MFGFGEGEDDMGGGKEINNRSLYTFYRKRSRLNNSKQRHFWDAKIFATLVTLVTFVIKKKTFGILKTRVEYENKR